MSVERLPGSGDRPLQRDLPPDYFDRLARRMRHIGRLKFGELPWTVSAPSELRGTVGDDNRVALELGFTLQPGRTPGSKNRIFGYSASITNYEPYQPDPAFNFCHYKKLELWAPDKSYTLWTGAFLDMDDSDVRVDFTLDEPLPANRRLKPEEHWQETRKEIEGQFTEDEYLYFMRHLGKVARQLGP